MSERRARVRGGLGREREGGETGMRKRRGMEGGGVGRLWRKKRWGDDWGGWEGSLGVVKKARRVDIKEGGGRGGLGKNTRV